MRREFKAVRQNPILCRLVHPVRVWFSWPRQAVHKPFCAKRLVITADFIELLPRIPHDAARLAHVVEFACKL